MPHKSICLWNKQRRANIFYKITMKSSTIIFRIVVFLIVLCMIGFSVLSVSDIFPDILIEPKWYFSLIFALSIVSIFAIIRLTSNYCINVEVLLYFFIGSATLISLVELVIVVLQKIGYFVPNRSLGFLCVVRQREIL